MFQVLETSKFSFIKKLDIKSKPQKVLTRTHTHTYTSNACPQTNTKTLTENSTEILNKMFAERKCEWILKTN